jgi:hypothetical protein
MFMDNNLENNIETVFGIHKISKYGKKILGIKSGEWYGPQMISIVLKEICNNETPINNFRMHVC